LCTFSPGGQRSEWIESLTLDSLSDNDEDEDGLFVGFLPEKTVREAQVRLGSLLKLFINFS
jgi:hypothetical protein